MPTINSIKPIDSTSIADSPTRSRPTNFARRHLEAARRDPHRKDHSYPRARPEPAAERHWRVRSSQHQQRSTGTSAWQRSPRRSLHAEPSAATVSGADDALKLACVRARRCRKVPAAAVEPAAKLVVRHGKDRRGTVAKPSDPPSPERANGRGAVRQLSPSISAPAEPLALVCASRFTQIINQFILPLLYVSNAAVFVSSFLFIVLGAPPAVLCGDAVWL